ncbi:hypothetical protein ABZP36_009436 [Zizania latifolia]
MLALDHPPLQTVVAWWSHSDVKDPVAEPYGVNEPRFIAEFLGVLEGDYNAIIHYPSPVIPPVLGADEFAWCSEWNVAMTKLARWQRDEVINASCLVKNKDTFTSLCILINSALADDETERAPFGFFDQNRKYIECLLSVNRKINAGSVFTGVFCFIHVPSHEL